MSDLARLLALAAALGYGDAEVATAKYRGTGERSTRRGWRTASVFHRLPIGVCVYFSATGPDDAAAQAALAADLGTRVAARVASLRARAAETRETAARLRTRAAAEDGDADADARRADELAAVLGSEGDAATGAEHG